MKIKFSANKAFDLIGKIGLMLVTGGFGGAVFTKTVSTAVAGWAIIGGLVCVIIGTFEEPKED